MDIKTVSPLHSVTNIRWHQKILVGNQPTNTGTLPLIKSMMWYLILPVGRVPFNLGVRWPSIYNHKVITRKIGRKFDDSCLLYYFDILECPVVHHIQHRKYVKVNKETKILVIAQKDNNLCVHKQLGFTCHIVVRKSLICNTDLITN